MSDLKLTICMLCELCELIIFLLTKVQVKPETILQISGVQKVQQIKGV